MNGDEKSQADGFLPVRLVGSDRSGNEEHIGDFQKGVVMQRMAICDIISQMPIAHLSKLPGTGVGSAPPIFVWEVPHMNKFFYYIFIQVMPPGAPVEIDFGGEKKRFF